MARPPRLFVWTVGHASVKRGWERESLPRYLSVCGSGQFSVLVGDSAVGREVFAISCESSRTLVRVRTTSDLGIRSDLQIELVLEKDLRPNRLTETGRLGDVSIADTLVWAGDSANLHRGGKIQSIPVVGGASFVGANFHTGLWLAIARYNLARGGYQAIPVFPRETLHVAPVNLDSIRVAQPRNYPYPQLQALNVKLAQTSAIAWMDSEGRLLGLTYEPGKLRVVREGAEFGWARPLMSRLADSLSDDSQRRAAVGDSASQGEELSFLSGDRELAGTLLIPPGSGPFPAVVLIPGTGALDRDGAVSISGLSDYRPLRDLATAIVKRNIAVLRFDNAGTGTSMSAAAQTTWDRMNDVMAGVANLRRRRDIVASRIGLLGHSEGGLIAMMVAAGDSNVRALVLLASPGTRGDTLLRAQLEEHLTSLQNLSQDARDSARLAQEELFRSLRSDSTLSDGTLLWLRSFIDLTPASFSGRINVPVLIVQGGRDHQVPVSNATELAGLLRRGRTESDVTTLIVDSLNHLFLPARTGRVAEYPKLSAHRLGPDVLDPISDWLSVRLEVVGGH